MSTRCIRTIVALTGVCAVAIRPAAAQSRINEDAVVTSIHAGPGDGFGRPVLLRDGLLIVGAPTTNAAGAVQIFDVSPPAVPAGELVSNDLAAGDAFGSSLAVSGNTLVVGAPDHDHGSVDAGAAYVFRWNGAAWTQEAELLASDRADGDGFGTSVGVTADRIVVGAARCDIRGAIDRGAIYMFERTGSTWTEVQKVTSPDGIQLDQFGFRVAIDGDELVAASVFADAGWPDSGAVYAYRRVGQRWSFDAKLGPLLGSNSTFGHGLDIEGDVIAVGMPYGSLPPGSFTGLVYIYRRTGGAWNEEAVLQPHAGSALNYFGYSVALRGDRLITGSPGMNTLSGEGVIFERVSNGTWVEDLHLAPTVPKEWELAGASVAIEGNRLALGTSDGRVLLFTLSESVGTSLCAGDASGSACPCGNASTTWLGLGCDNSLMQGASLIGRGSASVAEDDLTFTTQWIRPGAAVVLGMSAAPLNAGFGVAFGNGLRCIAGPYTRLGVAIASPAAVIGPRLAATGGWSVGDTRYFQAWYRDENGPCGQHFNTSNAIAVDFVP